MKNPEQYRYQKPLATSWGDMDAFGHINNVTYARYFEVVRADYFSDLQLWTNHGKSPESGMVIVNLEINFRKQAAYPQILTAFLRTSHMGSKSFKMEFLITDEEKDAVITAQGSFVWFDFVKGCSAKIPHEFKQKIQQFENT